LYLETEATVRADLYRRYALECLRFASEMTLPTPRAVLLDMAQNWLALADAAEKNERLYSSVPSLTPRRPTIAG
jgi:hypothetical protein